MEKGKKINTFAKEQRKKEKILQAVVRQLAPQQYRLGVSMLPKLQREKKTVNKLGRYNTFNFL